MSTSLSNFLLSSHPLTRLVDIHKVNGIRPPFDTYIGRATQYTEFQKHSIWHNPYTLKKYGPRALILYEARILWLMERDPITYNIETLRGLSLGCWCTTTDSYVPPLRCHGQVILKRLAEPKSDLQVLMSLEDWIGQNCTHCIHHQKPDYNHSFFSETVCPCYQAMQNPRDLLVLIAHDSIQHVKPRCDCFKPK
jgi:hypothetical protein